MLRPVSICMCNARNGYQKSHLGAPGVTATGFPTGARQHATCASFREGGGTCSLDEDLKTSILAGNIWFSRSRRSFHRQYVQSSFTAVKCTQTTRCCHNPLRLLDLGLVDGTIPDCNGRGRCSRLTSLRLGSILRTVVRGKVRVGLGNKSSNQPWG